MQLKLVANLLRRLTGRKVSSMRACHLLFVIVVLHLPLSAFGDPVGPNRLPLSPGEEFAVTQAIEKIQKARKNGDWERSYELLSKRSRDRYTSEKWAEGKNQLFRIRKLKSYEIQLITKMNESTILVLIDETIAIDGGNGTYHFYDGWIHAKSTIDWAFVKEGDKYYLDLIESAGIVK